MQAEGVGVSPHCLVATGEPAAGERPPRTLALDMSLPFKHDACLVPCVIGVCPLGREGPLDSHVGPLAMEKQLHPERVVRGFLYLSAGLAVIGNIGGHVRLLFLPG